jgi:hypothetical protein
MAYERWCRGVYPIIVPDNAYGKFLNEVPIPEGWKRDGVDPSEDVPEERWWFREPKRGEWFLHSSTLDACGPCVSFEGLGDPRRIILRRKKQFRKVLVVESSNEEVIAAFERGQAYLLNTVSNTARIEQREVSE